MAMTSYRARLMAWDPSAEGADAQKKWVMVAPIKGTPALGGEPEQIDASTNEDNVTVNILGRQSLDKLEFTLNYEKATYSDILKKYCDKNVHHFAVWFGEDGNGEDGIFEVDGTGDLSIPETDSYGLIESKFTIGNTTPIYGPQKAATDFTSSDILVDTSRT